MGLHVPFVVSERSAPNTNAIKNSTRILSHILMNYAVGFVFQTKEARDYYSKKIRERSTVIANPIDSQKIPIPFEGERDKRVVAVGRLIPAKNYPCLIDAFCIVHQTRPDYSLEIYGDGELRNSLAEYINKVNASSFIKLMGASNSVLADIRSASAYVLSSNLEGMPNALIEAMAMGLPCISTDCPSGGPRDLIENEKNGLLVKVNDINDLSDAIVTILNDKRIAKKFGEEAEYIRKKLDVSLVGNEWISAFEALLDR
jgi:glycosyltransferase involved in cell wall biosynthesis